MVLNNVEILVLSVVLIILIFKNVGYGYTVKTKKVECSSNPRLIYNYTCKLKPVNWDKSTADIEVYPINPIENLTMRVEFFKFTNQFRPFLLNITTNVCRWLDRTERRNAYVTILLNLMAQFSNVNHSCPLDVIKAKGLYYKTQIGGLIIPPGTYMAVFTGFEGYPYKYLGTIKYVVDVSERESLGNSSRRRFYSKAGN